MRRHQKIRDGRRLGLLVRLRFSQFAYCSRTAAQVCCVVGNLNLFPGKHLEDVFGSTRTRGVGYLPVNWLTAIPSSLVKRGMRPMIV